MCAAGAALAAPPFALSASADDHTQEDQIGQQVYNDQRSKNQIVDQSPYYQSCDRSAPGSQAQPNRTGGR